MRKAGVRREERGGQLFGGGRVQWLAHRHHRDQDPHPRRHKQPDPEDGRVCRVDNPLVLEGLKDPMALALLVDVIVPSEADEQTAGHVFHCGCTRA